MNEATFDPDLDEEFDPDNGPDVDRGSEAVAVVPVQSHPLAAHPVITAAQAKVDAVAALTATAYARAATLEITEEEEEALSDDFPDEAFQPGAAGKENLIYIEHAYLRERFSLVFGMGKWAIVPRNRWAEAFMTKAWPNRPAVEGSRVYVEAMLVIRGCFAGEAVGAMEYYPSNAAQNYGDAVEGAKTAAFRRCAKEFGVGLQAWKKDWCAGWWERKNAGNRQRSGQPPPQRPADPPMPHPALASRLLTAKEDAAMDRLHHEATGSGTAPPAAAPKAKAKKAPLTMATSGTRAAALDRLGCQEDGPAKNYLHSYLVALGWLDNEKSVEQWPVRFIPISAVELEAVKVGLAEFSQSGNAVRPYAPHGLDPSTLQAHPVAPPAAAPAPTPAPAAEPAWCSFIMPFGKKRVALGLLTPEELAFYVDQFQVRETMDVKAADGSTVSQPLPPESVASQRALRAALDQAKQQPKG